MRGAGSLVVNGTPVTDGPDVPDAYKLEARKGSDSWRCCQPWRIWIEPSCPHRPRSFPDSGPAPSGWARTICWSGPKAAMSPSTTSPWPLSMRSKPRPMFASDSPSATDVPERTCHENPALTLSALIALPAFAVAQGRDPAVEKANRALVVDFYNTVFNDHDVAKGSAVLGDSDKQHNPTVRTARRLSTITSPSISRTMPAPVPRSCKVPPRRIWSGFTSMRTGTTMIAAAPSSTSSGARTERSPNIGM